MDSAYYKSRFINKEENDMLIANLHKPWVAEQFRIQKLVEDQFRKIDENIQLEIKSRSSKIKRAKNRNRESEVKIDLKKEKAVKQIPHFRTPEFSESKDRLEDNGYRRFEVITEPSRQFTSLSSPQLLSKNVTHNVGLFNLKHNHQPPRRILTSHILPGVNIRPELVVESMPGLHLQGSCRRKPRIHVEYIDEAKSSPRSSQHSQAFTHEADLSITDSTTSKFEQIEQLLEKDSKECELKEKLKKRVREILAAKYSLRFDEVEEKSRSVKSADHPKNPNVVQDTRETDDLKSTSQEIVHQVETEQRKSEEDESEVNALEICPVSSDPQYSYSFEDDSQIGASEEEKCITHQEISSADSFAMEPYRAELEEENFDIESAESVHQGGQLSTIAEVSLDSQPPNTDGKLNDAIEADRQTNVQSGSFAYDDTFAESWNESLSVEPVTNEKPTEAGDDSVTLSSESETRDHLETIGSPSSRGDVIITECSTQLTGDNVEDGQKSQNTTTSPHEDIHIIESPASFAYEVVSEVIENDLLPAVYSRIRTRPTESDCELAEKETIDGLFSEKDNNGSSKQVPEESIADDSISISLHKDDNDISFDDLGKEGQYADMKQVQHTVYDNFSDNSDSVVSPRSSKQVAISLEGMPKEESHLKSTLNELPLKSSEIKGIENDSIHKPLDIDIDNVSESYENAKEKETEMAENEFENVHAFEAENKLDISTGPLSSEEESEDVNDEAEVSKQDGFIDHKDCNRQDSSQAFDISDSVIIFHNFESLEPIVSAGEVLFSDRSEGEINASDTAQSNSRHSPRLESTIPTTEDGQISDHPSEASLSLARPLSIQSEMSDTECSPRSELRSMTFMSSLSEGEWRASPSQLARLANMASSLQLL